MFDVGDRIIGLELPDTFYKLAELLEQDQFELLLSKNRIKDMHRKQDISLVYLMNDAVESFLVCPKRRHPRIRWQTCCPKPSR